MGRFFGHLGHPDCIALGIESVEAGSLVVQLVTEHHDQVA
jgi:hypothetical protein